MATFGAWVADATLAEDAEVPVLCSLTIANLTLAGAVMRQAPFAGQRTARLVGGFGGWRRPVGARSYQNPAGIPLSMILRDAAMEVGERVAIANDALVGTDFVRESAAASRVLRQIVGRSWWVDAAGVTRLGPRPSSTVASEYSAVAFSGALGRFLVATEDLAAWLPGAAFASKLVPTSTVSSMSVAMDRDGKLRLEVLAA